jgi:hypothetical protein
MILAYLVEKIITAPPRRKSGNRQGGNAFTACPSPMFRRRRTWR